LGRLQQTISELKRRRVFRGLVVYTVAAFAILQVIEPIMHGLRLPEWVLTLVIVLLALGFHLTVGLAWAFDLTASEVQRTEAVEQAQGKGGTRLRGARLALVLAGLAVVAGCASAPAPAPSPSQESHPTATGGGISSVTEGTGPPLFIIHGGWGDQRSFATSAKVLSASSTVTRVSLRLHWPNPWPTTDEEAYETYRVATHAADVAGLIQASGRAPVDLLGHSYGGLVAAVVARERPDLVRKLILAEPTVTWLLRDQPGGENLVAGTQRWGEKMLKRARSGEDPAAIVRSIYDDDEPGTFDAFPEARREVLLANARTIGPLVANGPSKVPFTCQDASGMRMPVLIVEGEKTSKSAQMIDSVLLACVPSSRRAVLPNAGHTIQYDAPETMARVVAWFLVQ
jgi:pimeloyl-ACP methyl ester carboxylesterase